MRFPHETIRETFRVLAPGGVMQVNMPFFFTIHNYPGDYMRLTPQFFEETCRETGFERVYCHVYDFGGLYYTLHNSSKQVLIDETQEPSVVESSKALHLNVMVLLMLASAFDSLFYGHSRNFFLGVYCAAFKAGEPPQRPSRCSEDNDALNRMLPYLACPTSHQPLIRTTSDNLSTPDGQFVYPVSNGIPILLATPRLGSTLDRVLTCPSCGSMDSVPELSRYDGDFLYDLRKCTTCSLVYLAYQLTTEEVARLEESNPTYTGEKDEAKDLEMLSKLVGFFEKYVPRGRILEVGCSRGFLLKAAANRGWSVTGVELCQSTAAYAHDHLGLPIYNKELSDCPFEERYFDLVVMWHTLEHLKQPGLMLRHIKELLRDGGAVAIQVPSYSLVSKSGDEDLKGRIYCKIHNFQFTKESLRFLLEHQGFRICYLEESKPDCSLTAIARSSTFMPYEEHAPHSASAYSASPYGLREAVSALTYPGAGIFARLARFLILIEHYLVWARVHFREGGPKEVSQRVRHRLRLLFRSEGRDTTRGGNGV